MSSNELAEAINKSKAKKLQGLLNNLEKRVKKLGAPPSPKTKITQSMERFRTKIDALKDHLDSRGEDSSEKSSDEKSKKPSGEKKEFPKKASDKPKDVPSKEGKDAEPKPKSQKETKTDKPETNGGDSAPAGKVKDIGKGIYENSTAKKVRQKKEEHPEDYCKVKGCMWRTKEKPCRVHDTKKKEVKEDYSPLATKIMDKMEAMHSNVIEAYGYDVVQEAAQEVAEWTGEVGGENVGSDMLTRRVINILQGNNYRGGEVVESSLDLLKNYRSIIEGDDKKKEIKSKKTEVDVCSDCDGKGCKECEGTGKYAVGINKDHYK